MTDTTARNMSTIVIWNLECSYRQTDVRHTHIATVTCPSIKALHNVTRFKCHMLELLLLLLMMMMMTNDVGDDNAVYYNNNIDKLLLLWVTTTLEDVITTTQLNSTQPSVILIVTVTDCQHSTVNNVMLARSFVCVSRD